MVSKALVVSPAPPAPTRKETRVARADANRVFLRDTVLKVTGQAVDLVKAQPYLALVGGYLTVHAMEKTDLIGNLPATGLKTLTLITAAAPAGWQAVLAAIAFGATQGADLQALNEASQTVFDVLDPEIPGTDIRGSDLNPFKYLIEAIPGLSFPQGKD